MQYFDTTIFKLDKYDHFCFNNGIAELAEYSIHICRLIYAHHDNKYTHPWHIWRSGYTGTNRDILGDEIIHDYSEKKNQIHSVDSKIFDATAMIIYHGTEIIFATNKLFNDEWNQDARITNTNDKVYLTYNSQYNKNQVLFTREIMFDFINKKIIMTKEQFMYPGLNNQYTTHTEKNWVINNHLIHYSVDGDHVVFNNNIEYSVPVPIIKKLRKAYGINNLMFSQGTPPIQFKNNEYIAVGHVKINHWKKYNLPFDKFMANITKRIYNLANRKIYMMFFYSFDINTFEVIRLSHAFIPTKNNDHLPYLLVFPISLITNNKYTISYGEGDQRCKFVDFTYEQIDEMLIPIDKISISNYKFLLLSL